MRSLGGIEVLPVGVSNATWNARPVWQLYRDDITGSQRKTPYLIPGVDSFPSGVGLNGVGQITVTSNDVVLDGWDFRNYFIIVRANNATIRNFLFNNQRSTFFLINFGSGAVGPFTGGVVEYGTFDDAGISGPLADYIFVGANFSGVDIGWCRLLRPQADAIQIVGDNCTLHDLYFTAGGYAAGAHYDSITISGGDNNAVTRILVDNTPAVAAQLGTITNAVRAQSVGQPVNGLSVSNIIVTGYANLASYPLHFADGSGGAIEGCSVTDSLWAPNESGLWFHPSTEGVITSSGNKNLTTGAALVEIV